MHFDDDDDEHQIVHNDHDDVDDEVLDDVNEYDVMLHYVDDDEVDEHLIILLEIVYEVGELDDYY